MDAVSVAGVPQTAVMGIPVGYAVADGASSVSDGPRGDGVDRPLVDGTEQPDNPEALGNAVLVSEGQEDQGDSTEPDDPLELDGVNLSALTFDLFDGGVGAIADYEGTPLVVNFFVSWCSFCIAEMPRLQQVFEQLDGRVAFLGLSLDSSQADAVALVERLGITYDVGWDFDAEVFRPTGGTVYPTTAFVSPSGILMDTHVGIIDAETLIGAIGEVLGVDA